MYSYVNPTFRLSVTQCTTKYWNTITGQKTNTHLSPYCEKYTNILPDEYF